MTERRVDQFACFERVILYYTASYSGPIHNSDDSHLNNTNYHEYVKQNPDSALTAARLERS